jgi:hypothetical protein
VHYRELAAKEFSRRQTGFRQQLEALGRDLETALPEVAFAANCSQPDGSIA